MFEAARTLMVGLLEIEHPAATIRLCDGAFFTWPGRGLFVSRDEVYGALGSVEPAGDAVGDEAPGGRMTLQTPSPAAAISLAQANAQGSPIRLWMAEGDVETGQLVGTPEPLFDGMIDTVSISLARGSVEVTVEYVSTAERLFLVKEGNVLSNRFHQLGWPGETGFALCTGSPTAVPWGVQGPPRGSAGSGSSFSSGGLAGAIAGALGR